MSPDNFTVEIKDQLNPVSAAEWGYLFPGSPNTYETIDLVQKSRIKEFTFHSILVRVQNRPVLLLPLFQTNHYLGATLEGKLRELADRVNKTFPALLHMRLLRVGIVDQQWGEIGYDRQLSFAQLNKAWDLALLALDMFCDTQKVQLMAFTEFTPETGWMLPMDKLADFSIADGAPFIQIPVVFKTIEDYLMSLPRDTRHFLRRSVRKSAPVETIRTREPGQWVEQIYSLYLRQVERSELNLNGTQNKAYFENACQLDPSAEYFLYALGDRLVGFELVCRLPGCLLSKFVAIDSGPGREHNLYFRSWMELVTYAIKDGIPVIDLGCTGEDLKTKLGDALVVPSYVMFKHRNRLINSLIQKFKQELAYESKVPVPAGALGVGWRLNTMMDEKEAFTLQGSCATPIHQSSVGESQSIPQG